MKVLDSTQTYTFKGKNKSVAIKSECFHIQAKIMNYKSYVKEVP